MYKQKTKTFLRLDWISHSRAILVLVLAFATASPERLSAQDQLGSQSLNSVPTQTTSSQLTTNENLRATRYRLTSRLKPVGDEAFTEPIQSIKLAAPEVGIVSKVNIKRGDVVHADDLLIELDMSVLEASRRLSLAKANTKARLQAAKVEFDAKTKNYNKRVKLLEDRAGSPEEVDKAKTEVDLARQNIEAIIEENDQYALETQRIESQMEQRRIRSPIDGVIIDVLRKPGEYVSNSEPHIVTVVQLDTLKVIFHLPTSRAAKIQTGHHANLLLTETNQKAEGIVQYVAPVTNADSGRVRVEVLINNPEFKFRSGVRCRILNTTDIQQSKRNRPFKIYNGPLSR